MSPAATTEQSGYRFAKRLALIVAAVTAVVFFSGLFYGPRPTEIGLPDELCAIFKGSFVYLGTRDERRCRWLIAAESHGWVVAEFRGPLASAASIMECGTDQVRWPVVRDRQIS